MSGPYNAERRSHRTVRRLLAMPISVSSEMLRRSAWPLSAVGRDVARGVLGALCGWPVSAARTALRIISLSR
jgi:hypothetical protein